MRAVRDAAERAGRDPSSVRIWSCYATIHDGLPEPLRLKKTVGRLATYLRGYGDLLVSTNGWDPAVLARFRADPVVASARGGFDYTADTATPRIPVVEDLALSAGLRESVNERTLEQGSRDVGT